MTAEPVREPSDERLDDLGRDVGRALGSPLDDPRRTRQRARLIDGAPSRRRWPWLAGLAIAAAAFGVMAAATLWPASEPLVVTGAEIGAWLDAPNEAIAFSDGSTVELGDEARARIHRAEAEEVVVHLARGSLVSEVEPSTGATWLFEAGPYTVRVLGTKLGVAWTPSSGELIVPVWRGKVGVQDPATDRLWEVNAGERLVVTPSGVRLERLDEVEPAAAPQPTTRSSAAQPSGPSVDEEPARPATRQRRPPSVDWAALARDGRHREALEALGARRGAVLRQGDAEHLLLLGDAARLAGEAALAERAYRATRGRFPRSGQADAATFRLGRLAMAQGRAAEAEALFADYVERAPRGRFASAARGRRLEAARSAGGAADARAAAEAYLHHHPEGPYAPLAREALAGADR